MNNEIGSQVARVRALARAARTGWVVALTALLTGCSSHAPSFLHPAGIVAAHQLFWLIYVCAAMAIVVVPIFILIPLFGWRYRLRNRSAAYSPDWNFSWGLEVLVWGVPVAIVITLAILVIGQQTLFDPYRRIASKQAPLEIDVVALNWKFLFLYPEQNIASVGTMAFPADRPITFRLTSDKTVQSFYIPALGSQIYAMAGMVTQLNLMADRPGKFGGENTQFNGLQFQREHFVARGMAERDFAAWVAAARRAARPLDPLTFEQLAQDGDINDALASFGVDPGAGADPLPRLEPGLQFSSVEKGLFGSIVARFNAMAPPQANMSHAAMSRPAGDAP